MAEQWLILSVAGLGWDSLDTRTLTRLAGLVFVPGQSVFPAVTCTAQASFRTAAPPRLHGMTANGILIRPLRKAAFWEQSAALVEGPRIWDHARRAGRTTGLFFWQQSLGETVDAVITPAPIHRHNGGMIMENDVQPDALRRRLAQAVRTFPLHRYWGPLASPAVGDVIVRTLDIALDETAPDIAFAYLPTLDYDLQRYGPGDPRCTRSFQLLERQLAHLLHTAQRQGREVLVFGDYPIGAVDRPPAFPNQTLRAAGFFRVRDVRGRAYPDLHRSRAFALADHEIAHVHVFNPEDIAPVRDCLTATGAYASIETKSIHTDWGHASAGELLLTARPGSWCAYPWWSDTREAPDFAGHVDIHAKPGYDPCELFFGSWFPPRTSQDPGRIRGTHGRRGRIAFASTTPLADLADTPPLTDIARAVSRRF